MSLLPGMFGLPGSRDADTRVEHVLTQRPLQRLLAFAGRSIDDVVNCPVSKRIMQRYYKIGRAIERQHEVDELEHQWNPLGRRT
jgi:hypothetical protein